MNKMKRISAICASIAALEALIMPTVCTNAAYYDYKLGDVNGDSVVDSKDASDILLEYTLISCGEKGIFSNIQEAAADLNCDGSVNSTDASLVLEYYSLVSTGNKITIEEFTGCCSPALPSGGFITTDKTEFSSDYLDFEVDPNIYIRNDIIYRTDSIVEAIQTVTGGKFAHRPTVYVTREYNEEWYDSETGPAYEVDGEIYLSPSDLLINSSDAIVHELCHCINEGRTSSYHGQTLSEGYAVYSSYLVTNYLYEKDPETAYALGQPFHNIQNHEFLVKYDDMYSHDVEYWMGDEHGDNFNHYCLGMYLMSYLDNVYGDYTKWMDVEVDESYGIDVPVSVQVDCLKKSYGDDVLDNFYDWLKANEDKVTVGDLPEYDLSGAEELHIYPDFNAVGNFFTLNLNPCRTNYDDLFIYLDDAKYYLSEYKGKDISGMKLTTDAPAIELFDDDGMLIAKTIGGSDISLDGVSAIRLSGKGSMTKFEITGSFTMQYED